MRSILSEKPREHVVPPDKRSWMALHIRAACIVGGVFLGLVSIWKPLVWLMAPQVYRKDFVQEYLLGRAVRIGDDPYLPISTLAERYLGVTVDTWFPHPTPHPPPVAVLSMPLSLLEYRTSAVVWLAIEITLLAISVHLLARSSRAEISLRRSILSSVALWAWYPFWEELMLGQLTSLLLLLLTLSRIALISGRKVAGGALIGLTLLVKPITWPLAVLFLVRREWSVLASAIATLIGGYGLTALIVGFDPIARYSQQVLSTTDVYRASSINISLWTLGWRAFSGTGSPVHSWISAPPIIVSDAAAQVSSVIVPLLVLLAAMLIASRARDLDMAFGLTACVSVLVSPVAWGHYVLLSLLTLAALLTKLSKNRMSRQDRILLASVLAFMLPSEYDWGRAALLVSNQAFPWFYTSGEFQLPFWSALLTLGPSASLLALGCLVVRQSLRSDQG